MRFIQAVPPQKRLRIFKARLPRREIEVGFSKPVFVPD
jgi:hypothetical protein